MGKSYRYNKFDGDFGNVKKNKRNQRRDKKKDVFKKHEERVPRDSYEDSDEYNNAEKYWER